MRYDIHVYVFCGRKLGPILYTFSKSLINSLSENIENHVLVVRCQLRGRVFHQRFQTP